MWNNTGEIMYVTVYFYDNGYDFIVMSNEGNGVFRNNHGNLKGELKF